MIKCILSGAPRVREFSKHLLLYLLLLTQPVWAGANYESEREKAAQIVPELTVGTAQYLETQGHKFLALYTEAASAKAGLVIVHGSEFNPDQGLIGVLRKQLPQHGYTTLSIQMPVLGFEGRGNQYWPLYPEAAARIKEAVKLLQDNGYKKIAVVSHSVGSPMTLAYLKDNANTAIAAWVSIGMPAASFDGASLPIYDLYGENDIPPVLNTARKRVGTLSNSKSIQTVAPNSDHFFSGHENDLVNYVKDYLDKSL